MKHARVPKPAVEKLITLSVPCPNVSLEQFLAHACGEPRFLWCNPNNQVAFAGMGIAAEITGWGENRFQQIERQAKKIVSLHPSSTASPRLFGGFAFSPSFVPDFAWAEFSPAHFVLPHFQLEVNAAGSTLVMNAQVTASEDDDALIEELHGALEAKAFVLQNTPSAKNTNTQKPASFELLTQFADWAQSIGAATQKMQNGELQKVVLARAAQAQFDAPVDIDFALAYLSAHYPDTYRFLFEPVAGRAFFGATPELLVGVHGKQVRTMALAGSTKRGATPSEDRALAQELLHSTKDRYEHQIVVDEIVANLQPISQNQQTDVGETEVMTLSNIQHLHTPIETILNKVTNALRLAERLHPTPALGGQPRSVALPLMHALENVTRGWYAAPIGWLNQKLEGEFAVAIRSAVAQGTRAWLYAGAGMVAASDPQREWDETALKFKPMMRALGAE